MTDFTISGIVKDSSGTGVSRMIRVHKRSDGSLVHELNSLSNGTYTWTTTTDPGETYVVCFPASGESVNAKVWDRVTFVQT